jgi:hypothetical protein
MKSQVLLSQAGGGGGLNLQQQQQLNQPPRKVGLQRPTQTISPQLTQQQQYQAYYGGQQPQQQQQMGARGVPGAPEGKISIPIAFALTTMRLGKVEQTLDDIQSHLLDLMQSGAISMPEYDEDGNIIPGTGPSGGGGANFGGADSESGAAIAAFESRIQAIEKQSAATTSLTSLSNTNAAMIKKMGMENMQLKQQLANMTAFMNKTFAAMDKSISSFGGRVEEIATHVGQLQAALNNENVDGGDMMMMMEMPEGEYDDANVLSYDNATLRLGVDEQVPFIVPNPLYENSTIGAGDNASSSSQITTTTLLEETPLQPSQTLQPSQPSQPSQTLQSQQQQQKKRPPVNKPGSTTAIDL